MCDILQGANKKMGCTAACTMHTAYVFSGVCSGVHAMILRHNQCLPLPAGLQPDSVTYHIMLSVAARLGDWQQVADLLHSMHSKGLAARPPVYSAYMRQLCRNRDWNQALGVFLVMQVCCQSAACCCAHSAVRMQIY